MKYILIIAENGDSTVDEVIHWLLYKGHCNIVRLNHTDTCRVVSISIGTDSIRFRLVLNDGRCIDSADIQAYYYRRGEIAYEPVRPVDAAAGQDPALDHLDKYFFQEWTTVHQFIHENLRSSAIPCLNSHFDLGVNKLDVLRIAATLGLLIPETIVTNDTREVKQFMDGKRQVVVKAANGSSLRYYDQGAVAVFAQASNLFTAADLEGIQGTAARFQPTLFQAYVEKQFEIRTFILKGACYSMAIFSQSNAKTKVDYRHYDDALPNRCVPYLLPPEIEAKLITLMNHFRYDSGSVDLIYTPDGHYYFLEVNTVGQLAWLSGNCNYALERKIAQEIISLCHPTNTPLSI